MKRPPTEAALLLDYAALLTHQRLISIDLAGKSRPTLGQIFQNLGFSFARRQFRQTKTLCGLISAMLRAVHEINLRFAEADTAQVEPGFNRSDSN